MYGGWSASSRRGKMGGMAAAPPSVTSLRMGTCRCSGWVGMLRAKVLAAILDDGDGGGAFGRRYPVGGIIFELHPPLYGVLWVKALSSTWTSDSGAFGVVTFLEASFLETQLSLGSRLPRVVTAMCRRLSLMGVAKLTRWCLAIVRLGVAACCWFGCMQRAAAADAA
jgi:hypothetical protein